LKVICDMRNHELLNTLVDHPYAKRLKLHEHFVLVDKVCV